MAKIYTHVAQLIGGTPLVAFDRIAQAHGAHARVLAKLECMNPAGSAKDRAALSMIEEAERTGRLTPGATIIEPTSGNTGIGLASVAVPRGYRVIMTMPETMSLERRRLIAAYGAEIVLTPGKLGMQGAVDKAEELKGYKFVAGLAATLAGLGVCLFITLKHHFLPSHFEHGELSVRTIGHALMSSDKYGYVLPFEVISLLLLACIVGGIMIARKR